jgi:hypothetical protein
MFKLQHKITPFLWYDHQASDAAELYIRLLGKGRVVHTQHWGEGTPYPVGSVMAVSFELHGQPLIAFNGGPHFKLNEAASLFVQCDDQAEVDRALGRPDRGRRRAQPVRLAQGPLRPELADHPQGPHADDERQRRRARRPRRAGDDEDEQVRHRGAATRL